MKTIAKKRYVGGFTLIEIMVVLSIISLLSSILNFVASGSRASAQDAATVADIKSMETAIYLFKDDNGGQAPGAGMPGFVHDNTEDFRTILAPLLDGGYITRLPSDTGIFYFNMTDTDGDGEDNVIIGSTLRSRRHSSSGESGTCRPFGTTLIPDEGGVGSFEYNTLYPYCQTPVAGSGYLNCVPNGVGSVFQQYPTICNDGLDNDGDGKIDYGQDPGCVDVVNQYASPYGFLLAIDDMGEGDSSLPASFDFYPGTLGDDPQCIFAPGNPGYVLCGSGPNYGEEIPTACNDGIDNDSDGGVDYYRESDKDGGGMIGDTGCVSGSGYDAAYDNSEEDYTIPVAAPDAELPQCSNASENGDYCICT